jgi:hypothetical protein
MIRRSAIQFLRLAAGRNSQAVIVEIADLGAILCTVVKGLWDLESSSTASVTSRIGRRGRDDLSYLEEVCEVATGSGIDEG